MRSYSLVPSPRVERGRSALRAARRLRGASVHGVRTFGRCPLATSPEGVDVAVLGVPFDTGTTNRPGTRFGPEAVRSASLALRPYNPVQDAQVFGRLSVADLGDVEVTPGNAERTMGQIAERLEPIVRSGTRTLCLGGDHTIVLGELRAHAAVHGPLGLVLLDAHADVWDRYVGERYYHGSPFRRAFEEGLLDPSRSLLAGMRGSLYGPDDVAMPDELGFEVIACEELVASATRSTARASGDEWARDRCSCRSTSTCSTRRSHPERVLRRPVVSRRVRRSDSCGRFAASASPGTTSSR